MADKAALLAQLRDIHLPPQIPEPGVLPVLLSIAVIVTGSAYLGSRWLRRRRSNLWANLWESKFRELSDLAPDKQLGEIAKLMRQSVLQVTLPASDNELHSTASVSQVGGLSGDDWLRYLDWHFSTDFFTTGEGRVFGDQLYRRKLPKDDASYEFVQGMKSQVKMFIRARGRG